MKISNPTYLIAELAGDVVPLVFEMRKRFNPNNIHWPVDISIAGSSGVGTIKEGQCLTEIVHLSTPILSKHSFSKVKFLAVGRFPNTGIYYLLPDRNRFDRLHKAVVNSDVEFNESEWPYNPHCTLRWQDEDTLECKALFDSLNLPMNSAVECFSLYQPHEKGGSRIHRF